MSVTIENILNLEYPVPDHLKVIKPFIDEVFKGLLTKQLNLIKNGDSRNIRDYVNNSTIYPPSIPSFFRWWVENLLPDMEEFKALDKKYTNCSLHIAIERADMNKDWKSFKTILNVHYSFLIRHIYMTASLFTWNFRKLSEEQQYELFGKNIVWPNQCVIFAE
jgi:hypothetical protein